MSLQLGRHTSEFCLKTFSQASFHGASSCIQSAPPAPTISGTTERAPRNPQAVDAKGKLAYVTGSTASADYPTTGGADDTGYNGAGDVFIASVGIG